MTDAPIRRAVLLESVLGGFCYALVIISLAEYTGGQYHVAHMSTAGATELVRRAKMRGLSVTSEVTPHHFTLTDDVVRSYDTNAKMNPPLRTRDDIEALKKGLQDGTIDVIATDHAPHSFDEKQVEFQAAPLGVVGLETAIGLSVTELVHKGILSLSQLVEKFSVNPRRILRLPVIKIAEGETANLTILDPLAEWTVDPESFKSRSKNTPLVRDGVFPQAERIDDVVRIGEQFALRCEGLRERIGDEGDGIEAGWNITSAPGYELTCQVPPNSVLLSSRTKSLQCFFWKRMAASSPENPVPMITVSEYRGCP